MKRVLFLTALVLAMLVAMTGVALAARYDSTYTLPTASSPHGNWTVNTIKCNVCHAVHNPGDPTEAVGQVPDDRDMADPVAARGANSQYLLRADAGGACEYCHIQVDLAIKTVYAENANNYNGGVSAQNDARAHDLTGAAWDGCVDCHQVHAASTLVVSEDSYLANKLLLDQPAYDTNAPAFDSAEQANRVRDNGTLANETTWCTGCHLYYQNSAVGTTGADTHTMKAAAGSGLVASSYCTSCHDSGLVNRLAATNGANNFPHYTDGARFLKVGDTTATAGLVEATADANGQVPFDGACLKCHVSATAGIGITH